MDKIRYDILQETTARSCIMYEYFLGIEESLSVCGGLG